MLIEIPLWDGQQSEFSWSLTYSSNLMFCNTLWAQNEANYFCIVEHYNEIECDKRASVGLMLAPTKDRIEGIMAPPSKNNTSQPYLALSKWRLFICIHMYIYLFNTVLLNRCQNVKMKSAVYDEWLMKWIRDASWDRGPLGCIWGSWAPWGHIVATAGDRAHQ